MTLHIRFPFCLVLLMVAICVWIGYGNFVVAKGEENVEYVTVDRPHIKRQSDVVALALSRLHDCDLLSAPLLVKAGKMTNLPYTVEIFRLGMGTITNSGDHLLMRVECSKTGAVSIREDDALGVCTSSLQRPFLCKALVSATLLLNSMDILPESFRVEIRARNTNEVTLCFLGVPLTPGRFSTVVVTPKSMRYYSGK